MPDKKINIQDLNKAEVLAVLYNSSKPQGMGFMHYDPKPMTKEEAQKLLDAGYTDFDYHKGRVMKVNLSEDELNTWGYDRDNGEGAAERAISALRSTHKTNPEIVEATHRSNTQDAARNVKGRLHKKSSYEQRENEAVIHLGLDDVADVLNPKVDEAIKKLDELKKVDDNNKP